MGTPATRRRFTMTGMVFWRIANGQLVERWAALGRPGLMKHGGTLLTNRRLL